MIASESMPKLNAAWHTKHPMPRNPSLEQRVKWHIAHARACACREIPRPVLNELKARKIAAPQRRPLS